MKTSYKSGKATLIVLVLLIIIIILLCVVFIPKGKVEAPTSGTLTTTAPVGITVATTTQSSEQPSYTVDIDMPTVSGLADASVQKKINDALAVKIKGVKDDFVSQAVNTKLAAGPSTKSFLQVEFKSFTVTKNSVLALRFETASYFSGAAHPIEFSMVSNFDLKTAHEFELIDLFDTSSVEYLHVISDFSTKALKTQLAAEQNVSVDSPDLQFFPEGATSNPENFSVFMVEDGGIRFIFGQYQVAPYVMGEQEVLIPYSVLAKYMKKGELMDALVK